MVDVVYFATNRFEGDGAETQFEVSFSGGYISEDHIKAYIEDDTTKVRTAITITEFVNPTTVVVSAPAPVGSTMVIYRDTPKDAPLVDFQNRSRITEKNLDTLAQQAVFLAAESYDATNQVAIQNLTDAAASAVTAAADAADSLAASIVARDAAVVAETGAETAEDGAQVAQAAAEAALAAQQAFNLTIGTVADTTGSASATITGTYPNKSLNLVLKQGIQGIQGVQGIQGPPGTGDMLKSDNLSGLANYTTARSNLGLGTAATKDTGTAAGNVLVLDGSAKIPAVDGSQITGISSTPTGTIQSSARRRTPSGWLYCDGTAVSRTTYAALFAELVFRSTVTVTIATPGVFTWVGHGLLNYDPLKLSTTGALPTGLTAGTTYFVSVINADTFRLCTTAANVTAGTYIATSGTQSGTHTAESAPYGFGDGSTTFNVPQLQGEFLRGHDSGRGVVEGSAEKQLGYNALDQLQGHAHDVACSDVSGSTGGSDVQRFNSLATNLVNYARNMKTDVTYGTVRAGSETRGRSVSVRYYIKT